MSDVAVDISMSCCSKMAPACPSRGFYLLRWRWPWPMQPDDRRPPLRSVSPVDQVVCAPSSHRQQPDPSPANHHQRSPCRCMSPGVTILLGQGYVQSKPPVLQVPEGTGSSRLGTTPHKIWPMSGQVPPLPGKAVPCPQKRAAGEAPACALLLPAAEWGL